MADYKKMYLKMARATEHAIELLIAAQKESEELYISTPEPILTVLTCDKVEKSEVEDF